MAFHERGSRYPYSGVKKKPVRVDAVLNELLEEHGVLHQVQRMSVLERWPEIVGETVAAVTRARSVDDKTLVVEVRTSAWLMELNMMRGDFLAKVNEHMPETPMTKIVFVLAETG
jgi:predicted nucleic acid-binding Zn ribbon protein